MLPKDIPMPPDNQDPAPRQQAEPVFDLNAAQGFYRAFEERHRGPRDIIKGRLNVYLQFVAPLLDFYQSANALDLGCGRGEWLELLHEHGFEVQGVDLDHGMLQACRERDLQVVQGDALSFLNDMADESCSIITGFHIVEHIPFDALHELIAQALRVLRPGGLMILETPNPENIVVGTANFYIDPTHLRPLPLDLLSFLPEYYGFARTKILRLQESSDLATRQDISLLDVLVGVSPDYAVIAQKYANPEIMSIVDEAFSRKLGLSLHDLAKRFNDQLESSVARIEAKAVLAVTKAQQAENAAQQSEAKAMKAEAALFSITNSRTFWLLKKLHRVVAAPRTMCKRPKQLLKSATYPLSRHAIRFVSARPRLKSSALRFLRKYPRLEQNLRRYAFTIWNRLDQSLPHLTEETTLSTRGSRILSQLKILIEKNSKGDP